MREVLLSSLPQMTAAHALYREFGFVRAQELDHSPSTMWISGLSASTCETRSPSLRRGAQPRSGIQLL